MCFEFKIFFNKLIARGLLTRVGTVETVAIVNKDSQGGGMLVNFETKFDSRPGPLFHHHKGFLPSET